MRSQRKIHKAFQQKIHCTQTGRWTIRRNRNAELCIPVVCPSIKVNGRSTANSSPVRISNSAGATPVRRGESGVKNCSTYSPELTRPPPANSADVQEQAVLSQMPPGPPASPVPSPPNELIFTNSECVSPGAVLCVKLRKRRNAICSQSLMGRGLRDFLVSYGVAHLTDSMTSSLNLTPSPSNQNRTMCGKMDADEVDPDTNL